MPTVTSKLQTWLVSNKILNLEQLRRKIKTLKQFGTENFEAKSFEQRLKLMDGGKRLLSYRIGIFKGSLSFIQVGPLLKLCPKTVWNFVAFRWDF